MEILGQRLRALCESVKLSQNKLAGMIGVRQSSINRYENGQSVPSVQTLRWYADYFGSVSILCVPSPSRVLISNDNH
jgi:transcriptional regulator with XRE-family HTH domain